MLISSYIKLKSLDKLSKKPEILTIGGFSAITRDGRKYSFDWCNSIIWCDLDEEGHLIVEFELSNFDEEYFNDIYTNN